MSLAQVPMPMPEKGSEGGEEQEAQPLFWVCGELKPQSAAFL